MTTRVSGREYQIGRDVIALESLGVLANEVPVALGPGGQLDVVEALPALSVAQVQVIGVHQKLAGATEELRNKLLEVGRITEEES
jgi:hypothetical protein